MSIFQQYYQSVQVHAAVHKRIWHMAWPPMLANITTPLLGLVDTAVVGHLGTAIHLGAVAIGASIFSFLLWAFGFLHAWGQLGLRRKPSANRIIAACVNCYCNL